MCGIFGFQTKGNAVLSAEQRAALLTVLSIGNERRGDDSWGFYNGEDIIKGLGGISKSVYKFLSSQYGFGHTRRGTTGAITIPNAHPFDIGDVIGAHNGIVFNHEELNKKYGRTHEVDSMHIFSHLSEGKGLDEIRAYGSIQYIEKDNPSEMYICKLSGGELSVSAIENSRGKTIGVVWSSDESHLKPALAAIGVKTSTFKIEEGMVYAVRNGGLYTTDKKLTFASRQYSELGRTWQSGFSGGGHYSSRWDDDDDTGYQKWLFKNRRGQTQLSSEQEKIWGEIRDAKALASSLSDSKEDTKEDTVPWKTSAIIVDGDDALEIPPSLAKTNLDFKSIINGTPEFSEEIGDWVSYDSQQKKFFAGGVTPTNPRIDLE
jgi:hypothetical protein